MTRLMLVGASGLARETLEVVRLLGAAEEVSVVDDDPATWGTDLAGAPVVGGLDLVPEYGDHELLVCVGRGPGRRAIVRRLTDLGVAPERYATLVHPAVDVPASCDVGRGTILLAGVVLTTAVRLGDHVVAMPHVTLTHDDVVDDYATLCAGVSLGGAVHVQEGAYLGMGATVREGSLVGVDTVLGMGAALVEDLPAGETWAGVPARPVRARSGGAG